MATSSSPGVGQRMEVLWHRGDPGIWYQGTALDEGRVHIDDWHLFVPTSPFVLEPEEVVEWRPLLTPLG